MNGSDRIWILIPAFKIHQRLKENRSDPRIKIIDSKLILPVETEGSYLLRRVEGAEVEVSASVRHCSLLLLGPPRTFT